MPRVTEAHREARRAQIRAAALRAFATKGYQRTSIADVIAEAGLSAGAIYGHYAGKKELFAAVAEDMMLRRDAEITAASRDGSPPPPSEILRSLVDGMARDFAGGRVLVQLWSEATIDPEIHALIQQVVERLRDVLGGALRAWFAARPDLAPDGPDEAARRLLPLLMALGQGYIMQRNLLDDFDDPGFLAAATALLPG